MIFTHYIQNYNELLFPKSFLLAVENIVQSYLGRVMTPQGSIVLLIIYEEMSKSEEISMI